MAKLKVDGKEITVPDHYTLLQAAEDAGAEVPRSFPTLRRDTPTPDRLPIVVTARNARKSPQS